MIRPAATSDAEAVDRIHGRAWRHGYGDFIAPERIDAEPQEQRVAVWRARLCSGAVATWVWEQDGAVAGLVSAGDADEPDVDGVGCIWALYVDPPAQGAGVGTQLLERAHHELRERRYPEAVTWVFRQDERGRRFLERHGWHVEEDVEDATGWPAPAVRYRRSI